jgi:succinate dehydrogenase flavoprotein subunit
MMQDQVGIVRREEEMRKALDAIGRLAGRAGKVRVGGNREYNPGWHTALDLSPLLVVSEAITRSALERKESRGAHFREDHPKKDPEAARFNVVARKERDGTMRIERVPLPEIRADLKKIIEENG